MHKELLKGSLWFEGEGLGTSLREQGAVFCDCKRWEGQTASGFSEGALLALKDRGFLYMHGPSLLMD